MPQFFDGQEVCSRLQWLKRGHVVKDDAEGIALYPNRNWHSIGKLRYFRLDETLYDPETAKEKWREIQRQYRKNSKINAEIRAKEAQEEEERQEKLYQWHLYWLNSQTSWQWIKENRVPMHDAKWYQGDQEHHKSDDYFYCHIDDTELDYDRAAQLLELYKFITAGMELPPPLDVYDGRPWW